MWIFEQGYGRLRDANGLGVGFGYSGHGEGKNNPDLQHRPNVGPLPRGTYSINAPHTSGTHGPYVMALTPKATTQTFGHDGFLIHGDSIAAPGTASLGCLILARPLRERIWDSGDHELLVVA